MSTVNMVKYYFYEGMVPKDQDRLRQLVALAYQTARDRKLYPKAVLIRYVHNLDPGKTCLYGIIVFLRPS
jgi:hypothetical protein